MASINRDKEIEVPQGVLEYKKKWDKFYHDCNTEERY